MHSLCHDVSEIHLYLEIHPVCAMYCLGCGYVRQAQISSQEAHSLQG